MDRIQLRKAAINSVKIVVSIALLYFVFNKIPFRDVVKLWQTVDVFFLILASVFFLFSQIISVKRLQFFLFENQFFLSFRSNLELYFVGMFYNFFIPGGIGGDAYKVYLLNKKFGWDAKKLTSSLFNDRLSGLIAICAMICCLAIFSLVKIRFWFIPLFFIVLFGGYFLVKLLFPHYRKLFWKTLLLSYCVQTLQVLSFICLLKSIGVTDGFTDYSLLFLCSSVLSLVSFAGIGVREMLFLQAAKYFDFTPQISISASLLFTVITAFFSLFGLFFQIRKVNLKLTNQP